MKSTKDNLPIAKLNTEPHHITQFVRNFVYFILAHLTNDNTIEPVHELPALGRSFQGCKAYCDEAIALIRIKANFKAQLRRKFILCVNTPLSITKAIQGIHLIEDKYGFQARTEVVSVQNPDEDVYFLLLPEEWYRSSYMFSWYTHLLRFLLQNENNPAVDCSTATAIITAVIKRFFWEDMPGLDKIIDYSLKLTPIEQIFISPIHPGVQSNVHHNEGYITWIKYKILNTFKAPCEERE